jgi:hypothetical protein
MTSPTKLLSAAVLCAVLASQTYADVVTFHSGAKAEGKIVARDAEGGVSVQPAHGLVFEIPGRLVASVEADDDPDAYLRFHSYRDDWSRLEVLTRTFEPKDGGPRVTLVGVVHIGDAAFYRQMQVLLDEHDVVLYEGVGAGVRNNLSRFKLPSAEQRKIELARPFRAGGLRRSNAANMDSYSNLQSLAGRKLDLAFQLEQVDYSHSWWIPADVTIAQLKASLRGKERELFGDLLALGIEAQADQTAKEAMADALGRSLKGLVQGRPTEILIKEALAQMLATQMAAITRPPSPKAEGVNAFQEILVTGRNRAVLKALDEVVQAPDAKTVAIFYGAAHNPDFERRLRAKGYRWVKDVWFPAWDIRTPSKR